MRAAAVRFGSAIRTGSGNDGRIGKSEMAEFDFAARLGALRDFRVAVIDIRLSREDVVEPAHGSRAALENICDPAEGDHRPNQQGEIAIESNESAERNPAAKELVAALPKHNEKSCADERGKRRHEHAPGADEADVSRDIFEVGFVEAADFGLFLGVSAHDAHAGKIFLDA